MTDSRAQPCVAIVGAGHWGRNIARNLAEIGALAAVVDTNPATAAEASSATGAPVRGLDGVLEDPSIAGVAIASSASTHYLIADRALKAGKHVFVEKPLVLDEEEADRLISLAASSNLILMVGHLLRYHPVFERLLELVRSGDYGPLRYVYSDRMSLGKIRTEENVLWSFAPHDISMVLALTGDEPCVVTGQGAAFVNREIEDWATVQMSFPSGVKADIRTSWMHFQKVQQLVAVCDRATLVFRDSEPEWDRKLSVHPHLVKIENGLPVASRSDMHFLAVQRGEPLKRECQHFLDCISQNRAPLTDGVEGRAVLRVLRRASQAMLGA